MTREKETDGGRDLGIPQRTVRRILRRAAAAMAIVVATVAIVLGESTLIARAPLLFDEDAVRSTAKSVPGPAAVLASKAIPVAVLH